ncbi:MAG: hypothetical protein H6R00_4270 [Proteobacteria bacterium]|nr:hypothetical protein [Pseudomonadota bacterium]
MIGHQVTFFHTAFPVLSQLPEHLPKVRAQSFVKRLPPAFRDENDVIFALPDAVA